jgi:hypothetical protein
MKRRPRCPITLGMRKILTQGCSRHVDFSLNLHRILKSVRRLPITNFIISTLPSFFLSFSSNYCPVGVQYPM